MGEKLLDVLLYLVRLFDMDDIDLGNVALRKVDPNAIKHPISKTNLYNERSHSH